MVIRVGAYIDQLSLAALSVLTVPDGRDAPASGSCQLEAVGIGEGLSIAGDGTDLMIGRFTMYDLGCAFEGTTAAAVT